MQLVFGLLLDERKGRVLPVSPGVGCVLLGGRQRFI